MNININKNILPHRSNILSFFTKLVFYINQGLTKARLKRDQMALGVFPNCHEFQKIDVPVLKKPSAIY